VSNSTDLVDDESAMPFRFRIADISPVPDDDVVAAITAALHEVWPVPVSATPQQLVPDIAWRFGQRRWVSRQIPRKTWGSAQ